jgi:hypothetical protein
MFLLNQNAKEETLLNQNCKKDFKQFSCWYDKLSSFRALQGQPEQDLSSCTSHLARWINCKKFNGI